MLGEIADSERRVFALSFHVDYWNRLGWKDPFSQAIFSDRQRRYARVLDDHRVYTPQIIVNGTDGFVGSHRGRAEEGIREALTREARFTIEIKARIDTNAVFVDYALNEVPKQSVINIALVERDLSVEVPRGENAGRLLQHHNVVRTFMHISPEKNGRVQIVVPKGVNLARTSIIGYVQNRTTMKILGAAAWELKAGG